VKLSDDGSEQMKPLLSTKLHAFGNRDVTKNSVVPQHRRLSLNSKMTSLTWFIGKRLPAVTLQDNKPERNKNTNLTTHGKSNFLVLFCHTVDYFPETRKTMNIHSCYWYME
jgi:hypothetical protein